MTEAWQPAGARPLRTALRVGYPLRRLTMRAEAAPTRARAAAVALVALAGSGAGTACRPEPARCAPAAVARPRPAPAAPTMTAPGPGAPEPAPAAAASNAPNAIDWSTPEVELLAERLHERVNGLAPLLLELGCRRLLAWRLARPPIEIELLSFADAAGARRALEREAGPDRTPGAPGDEGYASAQVVYFRSGGAFARVVALGPAPPGALLEIARGLERALATGDIPPLRGQANGVP